MTGKKFYVHPTLYNKVLLKKQYIKKILNYAFNKQKKFPCRSAEYEYGSMRCSLSDSDRRTGQHFVQLVDTPGTDYFEVTVTTTNK